MAQQLGFSADRLQQLINEVQRQHEQQQGKQQGGEAAAAKRPRLDDTPPADVLTLLDAAGEAAAAGAWKSNQGDGVAVSDCATCCSAAVPYDASWHGVPRQARQSPPASRLTAGPSSGAARSCHVAQGCSSPWSSVSAWFPSVCVSRPSVLAAL